MCFNSFIDFKPDQFTPLKVILANGTTCSAYYVKWSNYVHLQSGIKPIQALGWMYV